ncbi:nitrous oxide reductase family maturation protein NosD [Hydrogenimonas urashimensis]|uniref:nitrous oxide reductase family maturation protein NosD n=1 Tax=Hydrogenimonas urashimensis TaxID=2740515 RepID=UPI001915E1AA|nr:nitrous oxide reductase family maturation protein NosD [Hydrogenimonas urashimensis]
MRKAVMMMATAAGLMAANVLQEAIDHAEPGSRLELPAGEYHGNIFIDKPLIIDGVDQKAKIVGDENGTVIKIRSDYVTIKNLTILGSGSEHENVDAGISIKNAKHVTVDHCRIDDCLFGIDLEQVHESQLTHNWIRSKPFSLGLRGDAIRLWYSNDNNVSYNTITHSRDMVVWYSHGNTIAHNFGEYSRYSLHFMYAGKNDVLYNTYEHNSVGIFFMYSQDTVAIGNVIKNSLGTTGLGIGLKDASNFTLIDNTLIYCARGLYIDRSPFQPDMNNTIKNNRILYNSEGIHFHSLSVSNNIVGNIFKGNIDNVVDDDQVMLHSVKNFWDRNYWDDYEGFDKDGDGIGDTPYHLFYYADRMWMLNPNIKFFYASPIVSIMNFLAKLAPISEPVMLLKDDHPVMFEKDLEREFSNDT